METGLGGLLITFIVGAFMGKNWDKLKSAFKKK